MVKKEWILTFAMLLIGVFFIIESLRLGLGGFHRPGVGFLSFYSGLILSCVALGSLFKTFLTAKREDEKLFGRSVLNVATMFMALVAYILLFRVLGYLISTFLLLIILFKAGGFRRWIFALVASLLVVSATYVVFSSWLNMRFPKSFLGF